jgi:hypothetical protein
MACFAGLLGIFQVGMQCLCFYVMYVCSFCEFWSILIFGNSLLLFVIYYPRELPPTTSPTPAVNGRVKAPTDAFPPYRTAVSVAVTCVIHAVVVLLISVLITIAQPAHRQAWANTLGVMATILASVQYFPQIYTTFRLQRVGSLSIPTMCIQTPGSLIWAASLAARLGTEGWSAWGVYVVTAMLQGTLLVMGIYFEYLGPKKDIISEPVDAVEEDEREGLQEPSEQTPLLGGS